jgi:hypothetical protein
MKTFKQFLDEEAPVNAAWSENIAGFGEPGVSVAARKKHKKNNQEQGDRRTIIIDMLRRTFPNMVGTK